MFGSLLPARTQDAAPVSKELSIPQKNGASPLHASLVWESSALQAIEIQPRQCSNDCPVN